MIYSVPHTGTHFLMKLLGMKAKHYDGMPEEDLIISPIRDPWETYVSWVSRGRDQDFDKPWRIFNEAWEAKEVLILPIDHKDRDNCLETLGKRLNMQLRTNWIPENTGNPKEVEKIDLSHIYSLPVVRGYYEQRT